MAFITFAQRARLNELENELENEDDDVMDIDLSFSDDESKRQTGDIDPDISDEIHDIAEDLLDAELAEVLDTGKTKEAYAAVVRAIRDLHNIVCPDYELTADAERNAYLRRKDDMSEIAQLTEAGEPQQIADVYEYYPKNASRMAHTLAKRGDLYIGKTKIVDVRGMLSIGENDDTFVSEIDISGEITNGAGKRVVGNFTVDVTGVLGEPRASAYLEEHHELEILSEFIIDEQDFWRDFEREFHKEFKMTFEDENPEHEKFANAVHREYLVNPTVIVSVQADDVDVSEILDKWGRDINLSRLRAFNEK